ncbi:MAG: hypothetical protein OEY45_13540 [Gammaproteobacteria bacterium]|nr:hypothetical protein [Gammaproteobacteria bacterium]MDH5516172.1 hypothetical protein [Gammaproteobacteria bacterium]
MNNKQLFAMVTGLGMWCFSQLVAAAGPGYTYAELGYQHFDADKYDGNGARVNISYGVTGNIFLKMGYARLFVDATGLSGDIDVDRFNIGLGGHMALSDKIDALAVVSYLDNEYSGAISTEADEGYQVDLGVRAMVSKKAEINATAIYRHMALTSAFGVADDEDVGFELGTVIKMKKDFHFTGNVSYFDEAEETGVFAGIRLEL